MKDECQGELFPGGREGKKKCRKQTSPDLGRATSVKQVFDHYRTYHPGYVPIPTSDHAQWKQISARLKEGYTVDDLKAAIDGCHRSPFHQGENDRGRKYDSLELIMRPNKVQQFIEMPETAPVLSERTQRTLRARDSYLTKRMSDETL
jgi:hypothetical protein